MVKVPGRLLWAREQVAPAEDDRILEIGCGSGVLVSLICERLACGQVAGIDRSAHAIALARRRNREHLASGRAILRVASVESTAFEPQSFDKIVAVHVNLFWTQPGRGAGELRQALSKGGSLYLVYHALPGGKTRSMVSVVERGLREGGFRRIDVRSASIAGSEAACIRARR